MQQFYKILVVAFIFSASILAKSKNPVRDKHGMVVSASELASKVGIEILKDGGNAVDAAVAVGFALAVTHPSAGNIGGGGFMVIHLSDGLNTTIDFREKAPMNAFKDMYLDRDGNFVPALSQSGWTSSGVPGSVAGLLSALRKYGTMSRNKILLPAIKLAEEGYPLPYSSARLLNWYKNKFVNFESTRKIFVKPDGQFEEEDLFIQKDLAHTLKLISEKGRDGFYKGETADNIVKASNTHHGNFTYEDLEKYEPVEREPIIGSYRGYEIVSMGPPSSGGIAIVEALNIFENHHFTYDEWGSSEHIHLLAEGLKHVYADRSKYLGDDDFYPVPKQWLTSKKYGKYIFDSIADSATPSSEISPGKNTFYESTETTHFSIVDNYGNAVSTTVTLNGTFGNYIVVDGAGFLLNNEMDDFSAKPGTPNMYGLLGSEANSIQPEKRMLSAMSPTIVLKDSEPILIIGSPGGSTIITVVLQVIMNVLDFGMDIQQAIDMPRVHHQWFPDEIWYEPYGINKDARNNLKKKGYKFGSPRYMGRAEGILIDRKTNAIWGAADSRGNGKAVGY